MAINDVTSSLSYSTSQSHTSDAIGHAEDMSNVITNIDPEVTLFLNRFGSEEDATTLKFSWLTEGLQPPGENAHLEKEDYSSKEIGHLEGLENNCQRFVNSYYVTEAQRKVAKVYRPEDELARLLEQCSRKHAADIEYALVNNETTNAELNKTTPAKTGGVPFFMATQELDVTVSTADGSVTTTKPHGLETGDFVYFTAKTMPTGLSAKTIYYIRTDNTTPKTKFTIFNTQKGAVENITAEQVKPSAAGTSAKIIKNNVLDLGGTVDYTLDDLNAVMEMAYNRGGNPTHAFMSPAKKRAFSQLVIAQATSYRDMAKKNKLNLVADVIQTDYGVLTAEAHRMLPDSRIYCMDMGYWGIKWFEHTHDVPIPKKGSYDERMLESWLGLKCAAPKASAAIIGIKR